MSAKLRFCLCSSDSPLKKGAAGVVLSLAAGRRVKSAKSREPKQSCPHYQTHLSYCSRQSSCELHLSDHHTYPLVECDYSIGFFAYRRFFKAAKGQQGGQSLVWGRSEETQEKLFDARKKDGAKKSGVPPKAVDRILLLRKSW
jgi:hypothetical protein